MFEEIKYCLVWPDERPEGLSSAGWELVGDLLVVRGYLHRALPVEQWGFAGGHAWLRTWNWALLDERLEWNGFRRLALTESEREVLGTRPYRVMVIASRGAWRWSRLVR